MALYREHLPQLDAALFLTDGGIETTLIHLDGLDLPEFAAFPLADDAVGRVALDAYFDSYCDLAVRDGLGIVLETPTWRASEVWARKLGYSSEDLDRINRACVEMLLAHRERHSTATSPVVISGCIGPAGDGYEITDVLSVEQARVYHSAQIATFADSDADLVSALTLTYVEEAVGIALAAADAGIPAVLSFTLETSGRLPSGMTIGAAIDRVDEETGGYPAYYMINCAHPSHILPALDGSSTWSLRLQGLRANASSLSHAELDELDSLDRGEPLELADGYRQIAAALPALKVVGGCCGTDTEHVAAISRAMTNA